MDRTASPGFLPLHHSNLMWLHFVTAHCYFVNINFGHTLPSILNLNERILSSWLSYLSSLIFIIELLAAATLKHEPYPMHTMTLLLLSVVPSAIMLFAAFFTFPFSQTKCHFLHRAFPNALSSQMEKDNLCKWRQKESRDS